MTERTPPQIWRLNKERLNPLSKNPGLFEKMRLRQEKIRSEPKYPSNFKENQKPESLKPPRARI